MRGAVVIPTLASVGLLLACASSPPARTANGKLPSCTADADCIVTDFAGCCACCKSEPHAVPRGEAAHRESACTTATCAACSANIECPKVTGRSDDLVAKCADGTCAAVAR